MWAPSSISIDNDFSSSQTGVSERSSLNELARWVDNNFGVLEHVLWNHLFNDFLDKHLSNGLVSHIFVVLSRDKDIVHSGWLDVALFQFLVLNDDLRLAVGSEPWDAAIFSLFGHFLTEKTGKNVRVWVESLSIPLVGGVSKHKSLISSSHVFFLFVQMHTLSDLRRLSMCVDDNLTLVAVDSVVVRNKSDLLEGLSGNLLKRDLVFVDRHLTKKHNL